MKKHIITALAALALVAQAYSQRIAVLSDVHVTPGNANDVALREAVSEINKGDFNLVLMNGDLSNEGTDAELKNVKEILDGIPATMRTTGARALPRRLSTFGVTTALWLWLIRWLSLV